MLRLAFDFIITWRETRTRPNAYGFVIIANAGVNIIALIVTIMISIIASIIKNTSVINIINGTMMMMIGMMTMKTINTLIYF